VSIDFERIELVRDNLVKVLLSWRNQNDDGLWRSTPDKTSETDPSFTCSSEATQALTEAGQHGEAHISAARIDRAFFPNNSIGHLPFEATGTGTHIVNQAWATFVLQETRVRTGKNIWPAIKKLIEQQENGKWYLVPNDQKNRVNSPIFSAYCIVALAEFVEFHKRESLLPDERVLDEELVLAEACLVNAVEKLKKTTVTFVDEKNRNWWPIRHNEKGHTQAPNFEVTLLCLHALTKAGRVLKNEFYVIAAKSILDTVLSAVRKKNNTLEFDIEGEPVRLYDRFHGGSHNYHFSLYAPLCCVTILSYIKNELPGKSENLIEVVEFFVKHILNNMPLDSLGTQGVYSSPKDTEISIWATADAVIVLSRVLAHISVLEKTDTAAKIKSSSLTSPSAHTIDLGAGDLSRFDNCVAIYCPLKEEREVFANDSEFNFNKFDRTENWFEGEYLGFKLLMYQSTIMGRVPAAIDTLSLLNRLGSARPELIISTGICGGFKIKKVKQGDIVVPRSVFDIATRRISESLPDGKKKTISHDFRPKPINLDTRLHEFATSTIDEDNWKYKCSKLLAKKDRRREHPGYAPSIRLNDVLCSDEVVASENWTKEILLNGWEHACAVEMEAGGVCAAARSHNNIPVAVVKGVSDLANAQKGDDKWRAVAMYATIQFVKDYFEGEASE